LDKPVDRGWARKRISDPAAHSCPLKSLALWRSLLQVAPAAKGAAKLLGKAAAAEYGDVAAGVADLTQDSAALKRMYESSKQVGSPTAALHGAACKRCSR